MDQVRRAWKADLSKLFGQVSPFASFQGQIAAAMPKFDLSTNLPQFEVPTFLTDDTMRTLSQAAAVTRIVDQVSPFASFQGQIAAAMPKFDLSTNLPQFEVPTFLTDDTMRTLSQAAAVTRVFDQLPALASFQRQIAAAMPKFDLSTILPTLIPTFFTNESQEQLHAAALRIAASLPLEGHDDVRSLLPDGNDANGVGHVGTEERVLLLLLAAVAWIATVHLEAAEPLARAVSSLIESGVVLADLLGQLYNKLSQNSPDDKLLSWVLLLAAILKAIRKPEDGS